ncbi:hypothetical protein D0U04_23045 [Bacillus clarus]|uniref:Uncharacterized protein n=1 Tax=Bacillus clarus TaxID=2338372 RepID=A0ABX9KQ44_9BACI|nr:hypothetical protein D0U04_23045 [Bacillus clarus]
MNAFIIISIFHYKSDRNRKQGGKYIVDSLQNSVYLLFRGSTITRRGESDDICNFTSRTDGKWKNNVSKKIRTKRIFGCI